jgi:hypothetical protein
LEGDEAKRLLLAALQAAERHLETCPGYTATFIRQERLRQTLGPVQTLHLKVRHQPFSVYLKFLAPKTGKEVIFVEGQRDNKMIGHNGDWTRRLLPRLVVGPTDPVALIDNRHPITDAGLLNLTRRLIGYRLKDLTDPSASTVLDRVSDDEGQTWLRSIHHHSHYSDDRPFQHVEVHYDPDSLIPRRIWCYQWPESGATNSEERLLAESYRYDDLNFSGDISDLDFDPANPAYAFTRY